MNCWLVGQFIVHRSSFRRASRGARTHTSPLKRRLLCHSSYGRKFDSSLLILRSVPMPPGGLEPPPHGVRIRNAAANTSEANCRFISPDFSLPDLNGATGIRTRNATVRKSNDPVSPSPHLFLNLTHSSPLIDPCTAPRNAFTARRFTENPGGTRLIQRADSPTGSRTPVSGLKAQRPDH